LDTSISKQSTALVLTTIQKIMQALEKTQETQEDFQQLKQNSNYKILFSRLLHHPTSK